MCPLALPAMATNGIARVNAPTRARFTCCAACKLSQSVLSHMVAHELRRQNLCPQFEKHLPEYMSPKKTHHLRRPRLGNNEMQEGFKDTMRRTQRCGSVSSTMNVRPRCLNGPILMPQRQSASITFLQTHDVPSIVEL